MPPVPSSVATLAQCRRAVFHVRKDDGAIMDYRVDQARLAYDGMYDACEIVFPIFVVPPRHELIRAEIIDDAGQRAIAFDVVPPKIGTVVLRYVLTAIDLAIIAGTKDRLFVPGGRFAVTDRLDIEAVDDAARRPAGSRRIVLDDEK